jgi:hypothetical protein
VEHGTLEEQRLMWGLFMIGFFGSAVGIVDAALARERALTVTPQVGQGHVGVVVGGAL